jgi:2-polyprenyl-6-methoxyphenol hydroxylase-like FAD-dependent oxidoreductase
MGRKRVAILGAGPTGLEAALAAAERDWAFTVYEAGAAVASNIVDWGHVRLFSPWSLDVSPRMRRGLAALGRTAPDAESCPTGDELRAAVFSPLAAHAPIAPRLRLGCRVSAIGRERLLKHEEIGSAERARRPFRLLIADRAGGETIEQADVVLDCSGSYSVANRIGDGGIPAPGEDAAARFITRRVPDLATESAQWSGRTVLLVGAGHSAQTAAEGLAGLATAEPATRVIWALRRADPVWHVDAADPLPERSRLTAAARDLAAGAHPAFDVRTGVVVESLAPVGDRVVVVLQRLDGAREEVTVDRVLGLTGSVGDHTIYRQLQVHECYATSGPMKLAAALLGAGGGDCLAQESHGADTLVNPEPGFFILGAKSYGRNSTFLMRVGWQQVDEVFGLLDAAE